MAFHSWWKTWRCFEKAGEIAWRWQEKLSLSLAIQRTEAENGWDGFTSSPENSGKYGRLSPCVSYLDLKTMVPRIPKCLLLLLSTGSTGWSGYMCPQVWENRVLGTPVFSWGLKRTLIWIFFLLRCDLQKLLTIIENCLLSINCFSKEKSNHCNHFLELSWFF